MKLSQFITRDFGLYYLDLLGHGRSEKPDIEYTIAVQEDVIGEFVNGLGLENYSLMGNSYGGWVAARYSMDRREPTHLILEDSAGINRTFGELEDDRRKQFVKMVVGSNSLNVESVIDNIVGNNANSVWKIRESEIKELRTKTLIIWGTDDRVIPIENGRRLRELIPGSKFAEIEGAGHVPHVKYPEKVATLLNEFLKS
jgi:pimeloyl-ACP methyl ester carboxylesterase